MSKTLYMKENYKYRSIIYAMFIFVASMIVGIYFRESKLFYIGFIFIIVSVLYEIFFPLVRIQALTLPNEKDKFFKLIVADENSNNWIHQNHIVINGWIYIYLKQSVTNKKIKIWLHRSNFKNQDDIRILAKEVLF